MVGEETHSGRADVIGTDKQVKVMVRKMPITPWGRLTQFATLCSLVAYICGVATRVLSLTYLRKYAPALTYVFDFFVADIFGMVTPVFFAGL